MWELLPAFLLMLPSDKSIDSKFFMASCLILISEERKLITSSAESASEEFWLSVLRGCSYWETGPVQLGIRFPIIT